MQLCPKCSSLVGVDDHFCEACGVRLGDSEAEGRDARDHIEISLAPHFASITDRGIRHTINEDAVAIVQAGDVSLMVVCDGVSSTLAAAQASEVATEAMIRGTFAGYAAEQSLTDAVRRGAKEAQEAVSALANPADIDPPATTLVAALVRGKEVALVWLGDSRAYWLTDSGGSLLSRDDSWANHVIATGQYTPEEARQHRYAHAITKCLSRLPLEEDFSPTVETLTLSETGCLLLCSDGLWNYFQTPAEIAVQISGNALDSCRALVDFANARGGHDNISVALLRLFAEADQHSR